MSLALLALLSTTVEAAPAEKFAAEPWSAVQPGARVAVFASAGAGDAARTWRIFPDCVEVRSADASGVSVHLGRRPANAVHALPAEARVHLALCPSGSDPLSRSLADDELALPLPPGVPDGFSFWFRAGDALDVLVTLNEPESTFAILHGIPLARDAWGATREPGATPGPAPRADQLAVAIHPDDAVKLLHASFGGKVTLALDESPLDPPDDPAFPAALQAGRPAWALRFSALIPGGLRVVGVESPGALPPYLAGGTYVDLLGQLPGQEPAFGQQALLSFVPEQRAADARTTVLLLETEDGAVALAHVAQLGRIGLAVRNDRDVRSVDDPVHSAAPHEPAPEPIPGVPSTLVDIGARGTLLPLLGAARTGDRLEVTGCGHSLPGLRALDVRDGAAFLEVGTAEAAQLFAWARACPTLGAR
jgi:hypothetical protein